MFCFFKFSLVLKRVHYSGLNSPFGVYPAATISSLTRTTVHVSLTDKHRDHRDDIRSSADHVVLVSSVRTSLGRLDRNDVVS